MIKTKNNYFNPILVRIVGILLFIATLVFQGQIFKKVQEGALPQSALGSINGIISQLQVLIAVAMVVMIPKKGYFTALLMCVFNSIYILIFGVLLSHNPGAAPGVLAPLISIVVCTLIHHYSMKSYRAQKMLEKQNEDLIDTNDVITKEGERLSRIVYNDNLTGLYNKKMFSSKIEELQNSEDKEPFTVVYIEIEEFDKLISAHGKDGSNMILTTFAYRLHNFCGSTGIVARVNEARFALILTGHRNREAITSYISDLNSEICEPIPVGGKLVNVSVCTGITHSPKDGRTPEELMANSDNAVEYALKKGKGTIYFFS